MVEVTNGSFAVNETFIIAVQSHGSLGHRTGCSIPIEGHYAHIVGDTAPENKHYSFKFESPSLRLSADSGLFAGS